MDKLIFDRCNNANQFSFNTTNSREIYYYPNAKNSFSNLNILSISFENKMVYTLILKLTFRFMNI